MLLEIHSPYTPWHLPDSVLVSLLVSMLTVEGREISWSIYLFAVLAIILIFIGSAGLQIEYWAVAKAFVYSLSSCTALVMVLVPKLWGAHKQQEVDVSQLMDGTTVTGTTGRCVVPTT